MHYCNHPAAECSHNVKALATLSGGNIFYYYYFASLFQDPLWGNISTEQSYCCCCCYFELSQTALWVYCLFINTRSVTQYVIWQSAFELWILKNIYTLSRDILYYKRKPTESQFLYKYFYKHCFLNAYKISLYGNCCFQSQTLNGQLIIDTLFL